MWDYKSKQLGPIKSGTLNTVVFKYESTTKIQLENIHTPCSCTEPTWDFATQSLTVKYKPKDVPKHLATHKLTSYNDLKTITFTILSNGTKQPDSLNILAQVFDNLPNHVK